MEGLLHRVVYHSNALVPLRHVAGEGRWANEHAFQYVDHLYLQLRVGDLLVNR
jgi:hypothetical protein